MIERNDELMEEYRADPLIQRLLKSGLHVSENGEIAMLVSRESTLAYNKLGRGEERFQIEKDSFHYPMCFTAQEAAEFHFPRNSVYLFYFWDLYGWWYENIRGRELCREELAEEYVRVGMKEGNGYQEILSVMPLCIRIEQEAVLDKLYKVGHMYHWDNEGILHNHFYLEEPYFLKEDIEKRHEYERFLTAGSFEKRCKGILEKFIPKRD